MAIQWADDFSRYGTGSTSRSRMLDGLPYATIGSTSAGEVTADPDVNITGFAFLPGYNGNNSFSDFRTAFPTVISGTAGMLARLWFGALPEDDTAARPNFMALERGNGDSIVYAQLQPNGSVIVYGRISNTPTQVADTINPVVQPNSWNHYELVHNKATGAGNLYINGVDTLSWTGVDTADNIELCNFSRRSGSGSAAAMYVKDFVIWDSTGSENNSVMGTVLVKRLKPDGDVTLGDWVASTGTTGFNLLAKDTPNDTTYLSADDTSPNPMSFTLENLPPEITSVRGILPVIRVRKVDGGDGNIQSGVSPNGTDWDDGTDRPVTTAFTYYFDVSELDPDTGTSWTPVTVDSANIRIDRTV